MATLATAVVARGRIWAEWRPRTKLSGYCPDFTKGVLVATVPWLRAPEWAAIEDLQRRHARTHEHIETLREMLEERREMLARAREEQP